MSLIFSLVAIYSIAQTKQMLKKFEEKQISEMKKGIVLIPLLSQKDNIVFSGLIDGFDVEDYNGEIVNAFINVYNHREILFYYTRDINMLYKENDISSFVFDKQLKPYQGKLSKEKIFIAKLITNSYIKEPQYKILALKNNKWRLVKEEKVKQKDEMTDYQIELNRFKPEGFRQGILLKRLVGSEENITKRRKMIVNFETYFPLHIFLKKEEVFKRIAHEMNLRIVEEK